MFKSGSKLHFLKNLYGRIRYGAGCCDRYSLDSFLAKKIIKPLKAFRNSSLISHPMEFKSDKEWEKGLDEMIGSFEYFLDGEGINDNFDFEKLKENGEREQKGFELFGKHFRDLWI